MWVGMLGARITTLGALALDGRLIRGRRSAAPIRELVDAWGRGVATAMLVEAVWHGSPPDDATGAVQVRVASASATCSRRRAVRQ